MYPNRLKIWQMLSWPSKIGQRFWKFRQIGETSPNLVTLVLWCSARPQEGKGGGQNDPILLSTWMTLFSLKQTCDEDKQRIEMTCVLCVQNCLGPVFNFRKEIWWRWTRSWRGWRWAVWLDGKIIFHCLATFSQQLTFAMKIYKKC